LVNGQFENFHSSWGITRWIFELLPSFWAYQVNSVLVRLIGAIGMYLLFRNKWLAVTWAMLPIYSIYGLTVMGQPLLFWFLLRKKDAWTVAYLILFALWSHFALIGPFIIPAILVVGWHQKVTRYIEFAILLGVLYLAINWQMIDSFLFGEPSHRSEWVRMNWSIPMTIRRFVRSVTLGQHHAAQLFALPVIVWGVLKKKPLAFLIIGIFFFSAVYHWIARGVDISILTTFQFDRWYMLVPLMVFTLVHQSRQFMFIATVCVLSIGLNKEFVRNLIPTETTFREYYDQESFDQIKQVVSEPVGCIGFPPAIAQYNGLKTVGEYRSSYPLSKKEEMREVIKDEIARNPELNRHFEDWGNQRYMFSSELWRQEPKDTIDPRYNWDVVKWGVISTSYIKGRKPDYIINNYKIYGQARRSERNLPR
jgi:hypothetical protein